MTIGNLVPGSSMDTPLKQALPLPRESVSLAAVQRSRERNRVQANEFLAKAALCAKACYRAVRRNPSPRLSK